MALTVTILDIWQLRNSCSIFILVKRKNLERFLLVPSNFLSLPFSAFKPHVQSCGFLSPSVKKTLRTLSWNRTDEEIEVVLQVVKKLKCFDRYPMYVKRELAKVLYYDMFEKGRVVIKQGKSQMGEERGQRAWAARFLVFPPLLLWLPPFCPRYVLPPPPPPPTLGIPLPPPPLPPLVEFPGSHPLTPLHYTGCVPQPPEYQNRVNYTTSNIRNHIFAAVPCRTMAKTHRLAIVGLSFNFPKLCLSCLACIASVSVAFLRKGWTIRKHLLHTLFSITLRTVPAISFRHSH